MADLYKDPNIEGWMRPCELQWLYETALTMDSIIEVGSWKGKSTHALLSGCSEQVVAVDTFMGSKSEINGPHSEALRADIFWQFMQNVGSFPQLRVIKAPSVEAASLWADHSVDMVFIDAEHTYEAVMQDIAAWRNKCRRILCGHDRTLASVQNALRASGIVYTEAGPPPNAIWIYEIHK